MFSGERLYDGETYFINSVGDIVYFTGEVVV